MGKPICFVILVVGFVSTLAAPTSNDDDVKAFNAENVGLIYEAKPKISQAEKPKRHTIIARSPSNEPHSANAQKTAGERKLSIEKRSVKAISKRSLVKKNAVKKVAKRQAKENTKVNNKKSAKKKRSIAPHISKRSIKKKSIKKRSVSDKSKRKKREAKNVKSSKKKSHVVKKVQEKVKRSTSSQKKQKQNKKKRETNEYASMGPASTALLGDSASTALPKPEETATLPAALPASQPEEVAEKRSETPTPVDSVINMLDLPSQQAPLLPDPSDSQLENDLNPFLDAAMESQQYPMPQYLDERSFIPEPMDLKSSIMDASLKSLQAINSNFLLKDLKEKSSDSEEDSSPAKKDSLEIHISNEKSTKDTTAADNLLKEILGNNTALKKDLLGNTTELTNSTNNQINETLAKSDSLLLANQSTPDAGKDLSNSTAQASETKASETKASETKAEIPITELLLAGSIKNATSGVASNATQVQNATAAATNKTAESKIDEFPTAEDGLLQMTHNILNDFNGFQENVNDLKEASLSRQGDQVHFQVDSGKGKGKGNQKRSKIKGNKAVSLSKNKFEDYLVNRFMTLVCDKEC